MPKIMGLHRKNTNNIGDLMASPLRYFSFPEAEVALFDILGWNEMEEQSEQRRSEWKEAFKQSDIIIIGGGGLLEINFFESSLRHVFTNRMPHQKVVLWGAGHNQWDVSDWRALKKRIDWEKYPFDEVGVRDAGESKPWVPCPSCMANEIEYSSYDIKHDIVVYLTSDGIEYRPSWTESVSNVFPMLSNSVDFTSVIEFLKSGETVLTDSYHGVYWATLLGKKVVAFPSSSKFYSLKHPVPLCDPEDWRRYKQLARCYVDALDECRIANRAFYRRIENLLPT